MVTDQVDKRFRLKVQAAERISRIGRHRFGACEAASPHVGLVGRPPPRSDDELGFTEPDRNTMLDAKIGYRYVRNKRLVAFVCDRLPPLPPLVLGWRSAIRRKTTRPITQVPASPSYSLGRSMRNSVAMAVAHASDQTQRSGLSESATQIQ